MANKLPKWHIPAQEKATEYIKENYQSHNSALQHVTDDFAIETFHCYSGDESFKMLQAQYHPGGKYFLFVMRPIANG